MEVVGVGASYLGSANKQIKRKELVAKYQKERRLKHQAKERKA